MVLSFRSQWCLLDVNKTADVVAVIIMHVAGIATSVVTVNTTTVSCHTPDVTKTERQTDSQDRRKPLRTHFLTMLDMILMKTRAILAMTMLHAVRQWYLAIRRVSLNTVVDLNADEIMDIAAIKTQLIG